MSDISLRLDLREKIEDHITNLIKTRTCIITGDTSHSSIEYIVNGLFKNIDKPKENDWEDDNHNEKELINTIINII